MKVLVTGDLGFIGSHLTRALVGAGDTVIGVDDLSGGTLKNSVRGVRHCICDCRDFSSMELVFKEEKPEIVFHLAANAAENKAQFCPMDITSRNFDGAINVLTAGIRNGMKRFIFTSSIAVYGALQTPFKVTDTPEPEDLYGITKLAFEKSLEVMSKVHNFEYVIARPHNVYGPRQNMEDPYRNVVTIWMNALLRGEPYYIYGDGQQQRQFTYISDVVSGLLTGIVKKSGTIMNIGSNKPVTLNELSAALQTVTGTKVKPIYLPEREQEVKIAVAQHDNLIEVPLLKGLKKTWEWCKKQGPQEPIYTKLEIDSYKVPKNWSKRDRKKT